MTLLGKLAPNFKLQDQDGHWVELSRMAASGPLMLVFYPGDFTPVCTKQLCSYQDSYTRFAKYGLNILGISPDPIEKHQKFKNEYAFEFPLLSDPDKKTFKEYGVVSKLLFGMRSRAVFIVAKGGEVLWEKIEATSITHRDADELLEAVQSLKDRLAG